MRDLCVKMLLLGYRSMGVVVIQQASSFRCFIAELPDDFFCNRVF